MTIKTLEDCKVVQMDNSKFVTEEKLYMFSIKGIPLFDLPHGSLIFTGRSRRSAGGFINAEFGVWEGKEEIKKKKSII